jgi:hypothetical protein
LATFRNGRPIDRPTIDTQGTERERFSNLNLIKSAMFLNNIYLSYDVAFRFLKEHNQHTRNVHTRSHLNKFIKIQPSQVFYGNFKELVGPHRSFRMQQ